MYLFILIRHKKGENLTGFSPFLCLIKWCYWEDIVLKIPTGGKGII